MLPWIGALAIAGALILATWVIVVPTRRGTVGRLRIGAEVGPDSLQQLGQVTTDRVSGIIGRGSRVQRWAYALDRAGIRLELAEFIVVVGAATLTAYALGTVLSGALGGFLLAVLTVGLVLFYVSVRSERRVSAFADSLDDLVQLMATNLRAGHSVLQALDAVAKEMGDPTETEIARAVNQVRLGRDLSEALDETSLRMESEDFSWVAQAIAIHRKVGGNLADVLDAVGFTIRERNQIRRRVKTLSAEGRFSAWILMGLPIFVGTAFSFINPDYLSILTSSAGGLLALAVAAILMVVGGVWMRKIVNVEF
jgi:tight adherence protein B